MAEIILQATPRPPQGTRPARRLRNEGKIPGVVYGLGTDPITLTVEWRELRAALVTEQGVNAVIHLEVEGDRTPTLVKDMQRHPVRRNILHVDFIRVDLDKPVEVEVPVHLEGEAEAVSQEGGVIDQIITALLISAKPADIPSGLTVDISGLEIGSALRVGDITLPDGVTTHVDLEDPVVTASHQIIEIEEPVEGEEGEAAEGEAAEGEDGEAAEGEGGDTSDGDGGSDAGDGDGGDASWPRAAGSPARRLMFGRRRREQPERRGTPADLLVVGLGNPGAEYEGTRHNVGAEVVRLLATRHGATLRKGKERAMVDEVPVATLGGKRLALAIPLTYMNLSGEAVAPLVRRHGIDDPRRLVIVHDELDLPVGKLKVKVGGGLAGNNGLKSVKAHLHTDDFVRVRIGIGKPDGKAQGADHVLKRPGKSDREPSSTWWCRRQPTQWS